MHFGQLSHGWFLADISISSLVGWVQVGLGWNSDEAICRTNVSPVHQCDVLWWEYIGCRVQGHPTMARPNIRAKSSLTGGGLSCRLAWRTVCLDQSEFCWATAATKEGWTGRHAGTQIDKAELESWALRICPLSYFQLYCCAVCADIFHFTDLSFSDWSSECLLYCHPSRVQFAHKSLDHLRG